MTTHKTALVIGATGLIGRHLVDELIASDTFSKVTALTRKPLLVNSNKFENYVIDFEQLEEYAENTSQRSSEIFSVDVLFSCLGTTKKQAGSIQAQRKVDLDYQYEAASIARQQGVTEYFLVSSSGASANSPSAYLRMKGQLEGKVLALDFPRSVIFRPSLLLGKRAEQRLGESLGARVMPLLKYIPLLKIYRPIQGAQVAIKMRREAEKQGLGNESYNLAELFD